MVDFTKSKGMDPVVRQKRGPGMNLGLKKPRYGFKKGQPKDDRQVNRALGTLEAESPERAKTAGQVAFIGPASLLRRS